MERKLRILIVDDDMRNTRTLCDILTLAGHEPAEASSGAQALELTRTGQFDCVLTDVRMPGMDGVEFHRQLRQLRPGLPVVLMTAYAADDTIQMGLEEGVVGVFSKPLEIANLLGFFSALARHQVVAIVDNDPAFCHVLGDILRQRGFNVRPVTDPHVDITALTTDAQVVLLDLKLNSITGLDLLKIIRQHYPSLPVLMLTAYRQEMAGTIQTALELNASTCLYKPLEIPQLLELLEKVQLQRLRSIINQ